MHYVAPWWLPGGNLQTIWPALASRRAANRKYAYCRERWATPDADFIDVDWLDVVPPSPQQTLLVLFHGLEGSSNSHYARDFAEIARAQGLAFAVSHFRGCSGEINLAPRAYHSGDHKEIGWILQRFRQIHRGPIVAVGVSLGGNALLRWSQEMGSAANTTVAAVAAVSAPLDLAASGHAIGRGFNRRVYTRMFLNSMKPRALRKFGQYPGLFDRDAMLAARTLYEFDNAFTAPVHGFTSTDDYWARASAKPRMKDIALPALVVNARNDPFIPAACLPRQDEVSDHVTLWQPAQGGHVGFPQGRLNGHDRAMPDAVCNWLLQFTAKTTRNLHG